MLCHDWRQIFVGLCHDAFQAGFSDDWRLRSSQAWVLCPQARFSCGWRLRSSSAPRQGFLRLKIEIFLCLKAYALRQDFLMTEYSDLPAPVSWCLRQVFFLWLKIEIFLHLCPNALRQCFLMTEDWDLPGPLTWCPRAGFSYDWRQRSSWASVLMPSGRVFFWGDMFAHICLAHMYLC